MDRKKLRIRTLPSTEAKSIAGGEVRDRRYKLAIDIVRVCAQKSKLAPKESGMGSKTMDKKSSLRTIEKMEKCFPYKEE